MSMNLKLGSVISYNKKDWQIVSIKKTGIVLFRSYSGDRRATKCTMQLSLVERYLKDGTIKVVQV